MDFGEALDKLKVAQVNGSVQGSGLIVASVTGLQRICAMSHQNLCSLVFSKLSCPALSLKGLSTSAFAAAVLCSASLVLCNMLSVAPQLVWCHS